MLLLQHQITIFSLYIVLIILLGLILFRIKFVWNNLLIQHKGFHRIIIVYCFIAGLFTMSPILVDQLGLLKFMANTQNSIENIIGNKLYAQSIVIGILHTIGFVLNYIVLTCIGKIVGWVSKGFKKD